MGQICDKVSLKTKTICKCENERNETGEIVSVRLSQGAGGSVFVGGEVNGSDNQQIVEWVKMDYSLVLSNGWQAI